MTRSTKSASRSRSPSRSRSRSRSSSQSRSRSRSRSRKRHYSSRSRSRSHSPSYNRDKKYPKAYQNNREFRGYHRGFRRPYNFRGRGRGQFPRGRYQRGGGGGYNNNNNYWPNWKNYKQYPQKYQQWQQQQPQQFNNYPQGRSHNQQNRSGSPPQGQSHRTDRSFSPLSRHSHHSSSSTHSSPPKARQATGLASQTSEDVKDGELTSKQVQKGGEEDEEPEEHVELLEENPTEGAGSGKSDGNWQSPKKNSLGPSSVGQKSPSPGQTINTKISNDTSNGAPVWQSSGGTCSTRKPSREGLNPMLSSFDFFSTEEFQDEDKKAISIAFRKFLEEQSKKANTTAEISPKTEAEDGGLEKGNMNGKTSAMVSDCASGKCKEKTKGEVSLKSFLKTPPFLSTEGEEEDEILHRPSLKFLFKDLHNGDESCKPKISAQKLFGEAFRKQQNAAYSQFTNGEFDSREEERWVERKQDKAAAISAVLAKRELTEKFEDLSPEMSFKKKMMAGSPSVLASAAVSSNREMFMIREQDPAPVSSQKPEAKFHVRMGFLGDSLMSSSDILAEERQLSQDLVLSSKKDPEFRSIFQHVQTAQSQRSPSELFAQHIVTIVHHVKTQHFPSSGLTLNERFTLYQREAAEQEMKKSRKSPEIHRRIDVLPSAFKKPPQLFGGVKSSEEGTYKSAGEKVKGDTMDLRLDIERRKKYSCFQNQNQERDVGDSADFSKELCEQNLSKHSNKLNGQKRRRSSSSSSSSSSKSPKPETHETAKLKDEELHKTKACQREFAVPAQGGRPLGEFQIQICGKGWNKSSFQENNSYISSLNSAHPESEDPEFTPKSRKYYLHDDRDEESKWTDEREQGQGKQPFGRTRFIIRKATGGASKTCLKWPFEKFQANGEMSGKKGEEAEEDPRDEEN
ncbi:thyroid hormone receptor-associated protein 3 isoform X1 [Oryzias latipes]|uniref:Thyroid hormone receptor associated protein 3 n=1 Tax=Oryzias latipes TaxID=8090 RepID=A0A3B3IME0_ORYLA|nr:thyroid hormone receptor-associated protein 3 isoform X1 [Oryzias latipes]XP_020565967.1 thyroid hormone receptor-associated protein 3 isoform X1 [Oryzias latipes]